MKTCSKCKEEKNLSDFNKKGTGKQPWCKDCNAARSRKYYADNREKHIVVIGKQNKIYRSKIRQKMCEYLSTHPCMDCGEIDIVVLEFDHLSDKLSNIASLMTYSWRAISEEIKKCEVVCANCHRRRTAKRQDNYRHVFTNPPSLTG